VTHGDSLLSHACIQSRNEYLASTQQPGATGLINSCDWTASEYV